VGKCWGFSKIGVGHLILCFTKRGVPKKIQKQNVDGLSLFPIF
jgi:hypothetical protein